jgi:5-methylcytosine-specific restriction endonuclease McrA
MCLIILPTATITKQCSPHSSPICPYCKTVEEDRDHIMKFDHSSKLKWRLNFITSIRKRCDKMKTREMLTTILTNRIQAWFTDMTL